MTDESPCWLQVYDDVCEDRPDQRGQKRRFWQFNDSRPEPEPLLQPSRKQKAPKRKGSHSTQQPKVVDMSASSLSSRSAKAKSAQLTTEQAASPTEEGIEGPYTTPDGWTVINDSLVNSASRGAEEDILPGSVGKANVSLQRAYMVAAEGAQDVDSSTGVNDSGSQSIEPGKAWPEAVTFAEEQLPEATAAARFKAPERIQSTAKQKGTEHPKPSHLTIALPPES